MYINSKSSFLFRNREEQEFSGRFLQKALLKTFMAAILLASRCFTADQNGGEIAKVFSSQAEAESIFGQCPQFAHRLQEFCNGQKASCHNRCGTMRQAIVENGIVSKIDPPTCSCDTMCKVYGDCCWDFEDICTLENVMYLRVPSEMKHLRFSCDLSGGASVAMVTGCPAMDGVWKPKARNDSASRLMADLLQPVVTSKATGLTFSNPLVYRRCYLDVLPRSELKGTSLDDFMQGDALFWNKLVAKENAVVGPEQLTFVTNALLDETFDVLNEVPSGTYPRMCKKDLVFLCLSTFGEPPCDRVRTRVSGSADLCHWAIDNSPFHQTTPGTITTEGVEYIDTDYLDHAVWHRVDNFCNSYDFQDTSTITPSRPVFSLLFDLTKNLKAFQISITSDNYSGRWGEMTCRPYSDPTFWCDLEFKCSPGFLFSGVKCERPSGVLVDVVSDVPAWPRLDHVTHGILATLGQRLGHGVLANQSSWQQDNASISISASTYFRLTTRVSMTRRHSLGQQDVAAAVVHPVADFLRQRDDDTLRMATVCFVFRAGPVLNTMAQTDDEDVRLACHQFLPGLPFKPQSFTQDGMDLRPSSFLAGFPEGMSHSGLELEGSDGGSDGGHNGLPDVGSAKQPDGGSDGVSAGQGREEVSVDLQLLIAVILLFMVV